MLLSDSGFSILIRQAKPVPSKKNVINFCEEGKLWKAFGKSAKPMLIHPVTMKASCSVAYMFNVGGNDKILL